MPARVLIWLVLIAIFAGGLTILAAQRIGLPFALLGLLAVSGALALRVWMDRK